MKQLRFDIVSRKRFPSGRGFRTERLLSCGHILPQPNGGKANAALTAVCPVCSEQRANEKQKLVNILKPLPDTITVSED